MKWSIIIVIPTLFFLGCTSTASQARSEMSTQDKSNDVDKSELARDTSTTAAEQAALLLNDAVAEASGAALEAESVTVDEAAPPASSSNAGTGSSSVSTSTTSPASTEGDASAQSGSTAPDTSSSSSASSAAPSSSSISDDSTSSTSSSPTTSASSSPQLSRSDGVTIARRVLAPIARIANSLSSGSIASARSSETSGGTDDDDAERGAASDSSNAAEASDEDGASSDQGTSSAEVAAVVPGSNVAAPARTPATTTEVLQAVSRLRGLSSWTVIPFAHFRRGDRHAVVAWPAINSSGQLVDATVVGICLEETADGGLEECGPRWVVRERAASRAAMIDALGGSDYVTVTSSSGAALDDLGPRLASLGTEFSQAVSNRNSAAASRAAVAATRLLPQDRVAFENGVARLLYAAAHYDGRLEHVSTVRNGDSATLTFHVRRGIFRIQTITATARPVGGSSDRWIIVAYQ